MMAWSLCRRPSPSQLHTVVPGAFVAYLRCVCSVLVCLSFFGPKGVCRVNFQASKLVVHHLLEYESHMKEVRDYLEEKLVVSDHAR